MKLCSKHSHDLRKQLERRGLDKLINPAHAGEFAQRWLDGDALAEEFDPYVVAALEINAKAQQFGVVDLNDMNVCPLCAINRVLQNSRADESWVDNVADLMLITAKVNHLVPMGG